MPKINSAEDCARYVPNLPRRLRELRLEMGWSLDDLVPIVGVTQKGVISNWEATNHRRRTPPITTMAILQRWYGVSLDYLVGHPDAERDSPSVKRGRKVLRDQLSQLAVPVEMSPSDRARLAVSLAIEASPEAFFIERFAANLTQSAADIDHLLGGGVWSDPQLERLANLVGITSAWFYAVEPARVLNAAQ